MYLPKFYGEELVTCFAFYRKQYNHNAVYSSLFKHGNKPVYTGCRTDKQFYCLKCNTFTKLVFVENDSFPFNKHQFVLRTVCCSDRPHHIQIMWDNEHFHYTGTTVTKSASTSNRNRCNDVYRYRIDPVPGVTKSRWCNYYRNMRTTQEKKYNCDDFDGVRVKCRKRELPDPWDDIGRSIQHTWKVQTKHRKQWMHRSNNGKLPTH